MPYRLAEAAAAIHACSIAEETRVPNAALLDVAAEVLELLEVEPGSDEAERALGDVASLVAAYAQARADEDVSKADIRKALEAARKKAEDIDLLLSGVRGRLGRRKLDEAAAARMLLKAVPVPPSPFKRLFGRPVRPTTSFVHSAMLRRSGNVLGRRAGGTAPTTIQENLVPFLRMQTSDRQKEYSAAAQLLDRVLPEETGLVGLLLESLNEAIRKLPRNTTARASNSATGAMTLAWGCVELVYAWCELRRPSSDLNNPVAKLAAIIHEVAFAENLDDVTDRPFDDAIRMAVERWRKHGAPAVAFRGRRAETREKRIAALESKLLQPDGDEDKLVPLTAADGATLATGGRCGLVGVSEKG